MQKKGSLEKFDFDLEKEIKGSKTRGKEILSTVEERMAEIKKMLREGAHEKDFDHLGVLLQGYTALQKVIKKVAK